MFSSTAPPKITIITVCRNCRDDIASTLDSVLGQDYADLEYIIADGLSTDGTVDVIKERAAQDERIRYISEADDGIYDAMNKAARMATGDFLQFINVGDHLHSTDTLSAIVSAICSHDSDIYYGDSVFEEVLGGKKKTVVRRYPRYCSWGLYYCLGDCINHQAIIAARKCFGDRTFDTSFKVGADRDWMIRMKKMGMRWHSLGFPVVRYRIDEDSFSVKYQDEFFREVDVQTRRYFPVYGILIGKTLEKIRSGKLSSKLLHTISNATIFKQ
ncbi:MAG: glycosyltransferase [Lachnospiraceae bacterium]|nr:glycosyltransferase [Lachnospiraceae bacterium]